MSDDFADSSGRPAPRPTPEVARRVEELLREQLSETGVNPAALSPEDIAAGMTCHVAPDNSLTYMWRGAPLLYVTPELRTGPEGESVLWRMFTRDDMTWAARPDEAPGAREDAHASDGDSPTSKE